MAVDASIVRALEAGLAADPGNAGLRLHLARVLLDGAEPEPALKHCQAVLAEVPDHAEALALAAAAADALGDASRARAYRRLAGAPEAASADASPAPKAETEPGGQVVPLRVIDGGLAAPVEVEAPRVKLADVGGMEAVKKRLRSAFLRPLQNPELRALYGKSLRGGLLLYGPPGCGKTFIARATAGELGARFLTVRIEDVLDMWFGESERKLHELFEAARRVAPCVLFFDEIDALGQKRSQVTNSPLRGVVNQLLHELDSIGSENEGVFVLAATNTPWDVDPALRRPGRFDRMLMVLPPDEPARRTILELHLRERPVKDVDVAALAKATELFSGADLAHLCEGAAELALEDSIESGEARPITTKDMKQALREITPSTRAWFDTAKNYAMFANEGGLYDDLVQFIRAHRL